MSLLNIRFIFFAFATLISANKALADETIIVSTQDYAYKINEQLNPKLTLVRGVTYQFQVNALGHPFWIKTIQSAGVNDAFIIGISNNGIDRGTITFTVPDDAPEQLIYNCQYHVIMNGVINVINKPK